MGLNKKYNDEIYYGKKKRRRYFEGWYYKQVSSDEKHVIAFIPGISINKNDSHAFIQVIYNNKESETIFSKYIRFNVFDFSSIDNPFTIKIGNNIFSLTNIIMDISHENLQITSNIKFTNLTRINKSLFSPNIMGPFAYFNFLECYHGIISMQHKLEGFVKINDQYIDFNNGKGYIEKDRGRSFPKSYIWISSNNFINNTTSLSFSVAKIPFLIFKFTGFICSFFTENKEYRFATYNFLNVNLE